MARALALAERGRWTTFPNPRVGCVVVKEGRIVGEGWHERAGEPHAEVLALADAGAQARGADLYVTLEPCSHHGRTPPCADALLAAGVARVWGAMVDPNPRVAGRGFQRLRDAGVEVHVGLLEATAQALNRGFVSRMTRGRPFVVLKLAASLDGRTAMASGESQWITSAEARADVHRLRADSGAVLTSSATVLADDPRLTVRTMSALSPAGGGEGGSQGQTPLVSASPSPLAPLPHAGEGNSFVRQPDRVVLDSSARVSRSAQVWADGARRLWLTAATPASPPPGVEHLSVLGTEYGLDLPAALQTLGAAGINSVLVECGPRLAGSLLRAGLADELIAYIAPSLLGDAARPLARLPGLERLDQRIALRFTDVRSVGPDLRITAVV